MPDLTITRLGPGWLCQPKVPPGAIVFAGRRVGSPFVLIRPAEVGRGAD
jgi:hypothetical protein